MSQERKWKVKKLYWSEVRDRIFLLNSELALILDSIKLDLSFYLATYSFGNIVSDKGYFYISQLNGGEKNISDPDMPKMLRDDLDYLSDLCTPIGIVMSGSLDLSLQRENQHIPWVLMTPGRIFGLWRTLDREFSHSYHSQDTWYIKAGFQYGFMLPKISISSAYKKLARARQLRVNNPPRDLLGHYQMFKEMSQSKNFCQPWDTEILYFSKQWLNHLAELPQLELFFYKTLARQSRFWRNQMVYNFMWDSFIAESKKENIAIKTHVMDIAKHILMVAVGALPGFAPAIDNICGPIEGFQKDFIDIYGLKNAPAIMIPAQFDMYNSNSSPVYWSLQFPCYLESVPSQKSRSSHLDDLNDITFIFDYLFETVAQKRLPVIINTPIEYCLEHVKFDFFHSDVDAEHPTIRPSKDMPLEDKRLVQCIVPGREHENFEFSEVSPFVRGCVRFSLKK